MQANDNRRTIASHQPASMLFPIVTVYYGASGTGKTLRAIADCGENPYYMRRYHSYRGVFQWHGYSDETHLIVQAVDTGYLSNVELMDLLDGAAALAQPAQRAQICKATHIWLTARSHPASWLLEEDHSGVLKRICARATVVHMHQHDV